MANKELRVTGAWTQLLSDWLDQENLIAPSLRAQLDSLKSTDLVAVRRWQALLEEAIALRPLAKAPALAIGAGVKPRHVGLLGYLVLSCRSLGEALLAYQRYESLFYGRNLVEVSATGDHMQLRWLAADTTGELADTVSIAALVSFLRRLLPDPHELTATRVSFTFAEPADGRHAYEDYFGCEVSFAADYTQVEFPLAYLGLALEHTDPSLKMLLDRQAQALLAALPDVDPFVRSVQQLLLQGLPEGLQLSQVAQALHLSERSLQRRLSQRHSSWRQLLEETRRSLADHYLRDASLSLAEVALLLGYSEHSAFSRACQSWHRQSPLKRRLSLKEALIP